MTRDKVHRNELTPVHYLRRTVALFPQRTAVVHGERMLSYAQLAERAWRLGAALRAAGLEREDRVAYLCPNTPAMLEGTFGVPAVGGILVPINIRLAADEVAYIVEHSGARFAVVDHELEHLVAGVTGVEIVRDDDRDGLDNPYEAFLASAGASVEAPHGEPLDEEQTLSINYTSGTTGTPKGVMVTHRGAYLNALGNVIESGLTYDSVYLWVLPLFHCNGWCHPWSVTAVAGRHVCLRRVDPGRIWELLEAESVTHACGAPTVYIALVNDPAARRLSTRVTVTMGGAPPSPTLLERMAELNFRPLHAYGLTETYGPITICVEQPEWADLPAAERARLVARQGHPHAPHAPVRVVTAENEDVPRDGETIGEVAMRGNNVMKGYYREEEATEQAFAGGWFHSGDLAVWHPDGYIELRDRSKDIIVSGGENISTIEVEQVIVKHPAVLECAVIAIPDDRWGERPKAFVTLKPGHGVEEHELIDFCRERIAHYKCPAAIEFGELPKTSTGKIQKYVLREREWAGYESRIH